MILLINAEVSWVQNMQQTAHSESAIAISYSRLIVTTTLSRLVSEIFARDGVTHRQTDRLTDNPCRCYSCRPFRWAT